MRWRPSTWQPRHLLTVWVIYWIALLAVGIGSAVPIMYRVSQPAAKGNASVSFGDQGFVATITEGTAEVWRAHISLFALSLLIAIPPLLIWLVWLRAQRRLPDDPALLGEAMPPQPELDQRERAPDARDRL